MKVIEYRNGVVVATNTIPDDPRAANMDTLRQAALEALANNRAFIASTPTAGQTASHVKQMARQQNTIIRIVLGLLEGTD